MGIYKILNKWYKELLGGILVKIDVFELGVRWVSIILNLCKFHISVLIKIYFSKF